MLNPNLLINRSIKGIKLNSRFRLSKNEPKDNPNHDTLAADESKLTESIPVMRQKFRLVAHNFRVMDILKRHNK